MSSILAEYWNDLHFEKLAYKYNGAFNQTTSESFVFVFYWIKIIELIVIITYHFALIYSFAKIFYAVSNKTTLLQNENPK